MNENSPLLTTNSSGRLSRSTRSRRNSVSSIDSKLSENWVKYLPPDASAPQLCLNVSWQKVRFWAFPIELFFFFGFFVYCYYTQAYRQYIFQRVFTDLLSNVTSINTTMCYNQSFVTDFTSNATFQQMQTNVNLGNMYATLLYLALSGIVSLFLGPVSDIVGRKPILALTISGMTIGSICLIIIIYLELPPYMCLIPAFFFGVFGGHATLIGLVFAAVSDITVSNKWLTVRMGFIEVAITFAIASSAPALNDWIQSNNCNFRPTVWLMLAVSLLALVYLFFIPEPLQNKGNKLILHSGNKLKDLLDGFKCYIFPWHIGYNNWWRLCVVTCIISLEALTIIGGREIINYFLHNHPLNWTYSRIGNYEAIVAVCKGICLIVLLPLLLLFKLPNIVICLIACIFAVVANIMMATVKVTWEMYLAGIIESASFMSFPAIRSILSELVPSKDLGAVFSIAASFQILSSIGSTVLFNKVYHPQGVVEGHHVSAYITFWITAGFWAAAISLVMILLLCRPRKSLRHPERKGLISDESFTSSSVYSTVQ